MSPIQITILLFALFAISRVFLRFKDKSITLQALFFWIMIWFGIILVTILPKTATFLTVLFGVGRGADLLIYLSIILLFYLVFRIYVKIDNTNKEITKIVRKESLKKIKK
tara:strand:+ start:87 stop:416 length:330 start_codon:yes stop_codon:yes gene_type:complete